MLRLDAPGVVAARQAVDVGRVGADVADAGAGKPLQLFGEGNMRRDFTYIDDIVAGVIAAHDRALRLLPAGHQLTGQLAMMLVMVGYTFTGLYLLFGG